MANVLTVIDEPGSTILFDRLAVDMGTTTIPGSGAIGPFPVNYSVALSLRTGPVDLIVPNLVGIQRLRVNWALQATLTVDLNTILPAIHYPQISISITWPKWWKPKIKITLTWIHIPWPTVYVPLHLQDYVFGDANLRLLVKQDVAYWYVNAQIVGTPAFGFGAATGAALVTVGAVLAAVLLPIPFIGLFLAMATAGILTVIAAAGVGGLLGPVVSSFLQGREFTLYPQKKQLQLLPLKGPFDPPVYLQITGVDATIVNNGEDELEVHVTIHE